MVHPFVLLCESQALDSFFFFFFNAFQFALYSCPSSFLHSLSPFPTHNGQRLFKNHISRAMSTSLNRIFRLRTSVAFFAICFIGLVALPSLFLLNPQSRFALQQNKPLEKLDSSTYVDPDLVTGGTIMPKLGNETAK